MSHSVAEIATALGAEMAGDGAIEIAGAAEPGNAGPDQIALALSEKYAGGLAEGQARAAILWAGADWQALGLDAAIFAPRPRYAMSDLTRLMDPGPEIAPGIHPTAVIDEAAQIGEGAAIGPFVVLSLIHI